MLISAASQHQHDRPVRGIQEIDVSFIAAAWPKPVAAFAATIARQPGSMPFVLPKPERT